VLLHSYPIKNVPLPKLTRIRILYRSHYLSPPVGVVFQSPTLNFGTETLLAVDLELRHSFRSYTSPHCLKAPLPRLILTHRLNYRTYNNDVGHGITGRQLSPDLKLIRSGFIPSLSMGYEGEGKRGIYVESENEQIDKEAGAAIMSQHSVKQPWAKRRENGYAVLRQENGKQETSRNLMACSFRVKWCYVVSTHHHLFQRVASDFNQRSFIIALFGLSVAPDPFPSSQALNCPFHPPH
jgi:hypothetical protein